MGPQMAFAQELLVKGDLDHIINDLAPDLNQTIRQFEKFNVTEAETLLKANKVIQCKLDLAEKLVTELLSSKTRVSTISSKLMY